MKENATREKFGTRLGFILVSAGCAVGLGNVWKFPYICGMNGGAAFILIYLVCLLALGLPILICEFAVGRGSGKSLGAAYQTLEQKESVWHRYRWFGFAGNYLLMMFYTVVAGWMLYYTYLMATGQLIEKSSEVIKETFDGMLASPEIMSICTIIIIVLSIGTCALGLKNGVEKITKVMMVMLIILMVVMAVNSVTLKDASKGIEFYLIPNFSKMKEQGIGNVIFAAMTHAFFTLSVGMGSMEIFGSYLTKERKIFGEAVNVVMIDTFIALTAGIIIIPSCFAYGLQPDAGPSLLFITLPNVFSNMPLGNVWGMMFFVFMSFAAMSTVIAVFENIIAMTMDLMKWERNKSVLVNLVGITVGSIPTIVGFNILSNIQPFGTGTTIMDFEDFLVSYNILPLGSLLFVLFCVKKNGWGFGNFMNEVNTGEGRNFPKWMRFYMTYVLPIIVLVIYFKGYYDMFKDKGTTTLVIWMGVATLMAGFAIYLAFGRTKTKKEETLTNYLL